MKSINDQDNLNNKKILLRLDLNVPLDDGKITDTTRIDKIIPTLKFLISQNTKIIIISHVGRPKGKTLNELSLKPICDDLENKLNHKIKLIRDNFKEFDNKDIFQDHNENIVMLENIRFYSEEENNDLEFAKCLSNLADMYVNDAFSCSHRAHASIHQITNYLPSYSGLQLDLEVNALKKITSEIKKPITCIIGGSKISTKINIIKNLTLEGLTGKARLGYMMKELNKGSINADTFQKFLLNELKAKNISREDSYLMVQRNSMKVWNDEGSFYELIKKDKEICSILSNDEIDDIFDLNYHLKHIEEIFQRVLE